MKFLKHKFFSLYLGVSPYRSFSIKLQEYAAQVQGSTFVQMGCITSKVISKSMSFHKEMSHSLQRTTDGIPFFEDLFTTSPIPALDPSSAKTIDARELIAGLEQHLVKQEGQHGDPSLPSTSAVASLDFYNAKRSKSCHWSPEHELPAQIPRDDRLARDEVNWGSRVIVRSKSFHTVEEYDAMVENIQLVREPGRGLCDEHDLATKMKQHSKCSSKETHHADYYISDIHGATQSSPGDVESIRENSISMTDETGICKTSGPGTKEIFPSLNNSTIIEESIFFENVAHGGSISGKGLKRKAVAKGLKSIEIPSTVEFPSIAKGLREWLHMGGQVYSPGAYVTPKFGSYNLPNPPPRSGNECSEESIFDPNLVSAFEKCMQQLEAEEEIILQEIEQVLEKDRTNDTEAKEECSSNTHLDPQSG